MHILYMPFEASVRVIQKLPNVNGILPYGVFRAGNRYLSSVLCGSKTKFCGIYNTVDDASLEAKKAECANSYSGRVTYSGI